MTAFPLPTNLLGDSTDSLWQQKKSVELHEGYTSKNKTESIKRFKNISFLTDAYYW